MADIRIKIAKDKAKLVKELRAGEGSTGPFQTYADVVTFAAAFGFSRHNRIPFEEVSRRDPDPIPGDQFKNRAIMDLIAVMATQDPNILGNSDEKLQEKGRIFEEYANGAGCLTQVPQMAEIRNVVSRVSGDVSGSQLTGDSKF